MSSKKRPVSVSSMSKLLGLSRAHFYTLMRRNVFPKPVVVGARPMYTPELQEQCLEVKRTGITITGEFIYFNEKLKPSAAKPSRSTKKFATLIESLQGLGLQVNAGQIEAAIKDLYPNEKPDLESPEAIKTVFLHLKS